MTTPPQPSTHRLAVEIRAGSWRGRTASGGFDIPIQRTAQGNITDESKTAVVQALNDLTGKWRGPYVKMVRLDPWSNPYQYRSPGQNGSLTFDLWSRGADGADGGEAEGADITNWQ